MDVPNSITHHQWKGGGIKKKGGREKKKREWEVKIN